MQSLTEQLFKLAPPSGLFDKSVVASLFPKSSAAAKQNLISRACAAGEVSIIRRGLYLLEPPFRQVGIDPIMLSSLIYGPSYISFESALRFYGLIPDIVQTVSAATSRRSCMFNTSVGYFTFTRVPVRSLLAGVRGIAMESGHRGVTTLMASPARAIADLVYLRRDVCWDKEGFDFLEGSMRIEPEELWAQLLKKDLEAVFDAYRNQRVRSFITGLMTGRSAALMTKQSRTRVVSE